MLRIDKNGTPAPGNMGAPFDPRIQSYGHRNVQGIAFRSNGQVFAVEHGTGCDDEVNLLITGANYGWDPVPRMAGDPSYNEITPMTDTRPLSPARSPRSAAPGARRSRRRAATFVYGPQWGQWNGGLVMAVLKGSHLRMLRLSADGWRLTAIVVALERPRSPAHRRVIGPDGALYVTTSNGGEHGLHPQGGSGAAHAASWPRAEDREIARGVPAWIGGHDLESIEAINAVTLVTADMAAAVRSTGPSASACCPAGRTPRSRRSGPATASSTSSSIRRTRRSPGSGDG